MMYLRECRIENVGPLEFVDLTIPFNDDGTPKPVVLVGRNGSGKSILLSHVVDALIEFAKAAYRDIVEGQQPFGNPYFKVVGGTNQRFGAAYGLALLAFGEGESVHSYVDKTGTLDPDPYIEKIGGRFPGVGTWPIEGSLKRAKMSKEYAQSFFKRSSVCYFPSARHERPHWLNPKAVADHPIFYFAENYSDHLYKPVIVESSANETKQWALDVIVDSLVELEPYEEITQEGETAERWQMTSGANVNLILRQSLANVEEVLKAILQDDNARLRLGLRAAGRSRLSIALSNEATIPSLDHLSSGQATLFNLFSTIIRYADRADMNKSIRLVDIEGIVLVDEIEAQAHSDLQYGVLPRLIKLFPRVQFILTSHSPLFLLGMEK